MEKQYNERYNAWLMHQNDEEGMLSENSNIIEEDNLNFNDDKKICCCIKLTTFVKYLPIIFITCTITDFFLYI